MADYWKSQPRKFCQYCKCWIADNKPSIEFHERGKNHKENVAAKITEIKKKSIDKAKQEERMSKEFAAMEEAALKAYQEDLKRMERESQGFSCPVQAPSRAQPQPLVTQVKPQAAPQAKHPSKKHKKKEGKAVMKFRGRTETPVWVEGLSDEGHTYYYNTATGESKWEKPEGFQEESSASAQTEQAESSSGCPWKEAVSPDGYTYYYNEQTGESSWEKPADFPSNEASESSSESNKEGESQEQSSEPEPEPLSGGEERSSEVPAPQETEAPEQANQQPKVPKISFRKRRAETDPPEKEGEENSSDDKSSDDLPKEDDKEVKKEEEVQSTAAAPEKTEKQSTQQQTHAKKPRTANPYGAWEQIQEEEDPYANVDLQLPEAEGSTVDAPADLPPEPKLKFKERVITSLGEEGGPASFRKNKTQNGKSRRLRQRDNDD